MNNNLLILGAGGHGRVVKEIAESMRIFHKIDFLDDNPEFDGSIGICSDNKKFVSTYKYAFPAFGNKKMRIDFMEELIKNGFEIPTLIHPTAFVSNSAFVDIGTVIGANAIVNTNSKIGEGCILSVGAIIDHDVIIGGGCHIDCGAIVKSNSVIKVTEKIESGKVVKCQED